MDMDFVRKRITELRMLRGKSEYQLSYETGHSKNYIHNIVTGYSQPSVTELLYLIDVLGVTPRDFFDEDTEYKNPLLAKQIMDGLKDMDEDDLRAVLAVVERLGKKDRVYSKGPLQNKPIKNKRGLEPERVSKPRRLLYS